MLTALVLGGTRNGMAYICQMCAEIPDLAVIRSLDTFPKVHNLGRLLNSFCPQMVLLEACEDNAWLELAEAMLDFHATMPLLVFSIGAPQRSVLSAVRLGLPVLNAPFSGEKFQEAIFRALDRGPAGKKERLIAFLPAKGGSGATTTALCTAMMVAQGLDKRVLFLECDIESGPVALYLNLAPKHSIIEALENEQLLDRPLTDIAIRVGGVDVLPSVGRRAKGRLSAWNCQRLLSRARGLYDFVFCDLPDVFDEAFEPVVRSADQIVLVTTASAPASFLASRRLKTLSELGAGESKVRLVVNRLRPSDEVPKRISTVGVSACIPNRSSLLDASRLEMNKIAGTDLEAPFLSIAEICAGQQFPTKKGKYYQSLKSLWGTATQGLSGDRAEAVRGEECL